jgi:hypothetical protein
MVPQSRPLTVLAVQNSLTARTFRSAEDELPTSAI